ncbi:FAD-dependent oxidoreductase [Dyadobacter sp. CY261]|uniref:FAD-dependent oxidoreductase n=1 Tax=Dyadobacter sp. CY261 TaxID=2907203 RepID=UPI001F427FE9|nr:FAD-dependent oxidoreductase [Dyadobacter sp. CY261]MCF0069617.1 FAD-dependent oxidoreductase [Dyadobacter sp. CY261]
MGVNQNTRDGRNQSLWQKNISNDHEHRAFDPSQTYDVLIVGAGITGITTALLLQKAGMQCAIADAHNPGYGTTGGTTAHINTFADTTFAEVESAFSEDAAQQFADSIAESVDLIHELVNIYQIDCDFEWKNGYVYSQTDKETKELDDILNSSLKVGVEVRVSNQVPVTVDFQKAIVFGRQAQFHPLKYILALQTEFRNLGGVVLENTLIQDVQTLDGFHIASAPSAKIKAKAIVYATHIPPGGVNVLHFRNAPYRSYVIAATLTSDAYPEDLVYDMQEPYHYFRTHMIDGQKYLVAGGHDHKTGHGDPEQSFADLIAFTRQCYPVKDIFTQWSAQYYVPADGLPYIGKLPGASDGIYAATGFSGNGMILGTVSAMVLSDLIIQGKSVYEELYNPARIKPIAGFAEVVKEGVDVVARFIGDRLGLEDIKSVSQLPVDSGEVVEYDGQKLAIYRDPNGNIQALDPVCTHTKCIVHWNNSEKSWDCPCHGARFDTDGTVLTGPARENLARVLTKPEVQE